MKAVKRFTIWVSAFALVAFSLIEISGHIILSRSVKSADSLVPLEFFRATDSRQQWEIITAAMEAGPDGGFTLTNVDIERAKELVYVGLTCAPEEKEGNDYVSASAATMRFLREIYPDSKALTSDTGGMLSLRRLRENIYQAPPQGWLVVWACLFGEW